MGTDAIQVANPWSTRILAALFHLGMLAVAVSCVVTLQPPIYETQYFALTAALGVALIVVMAVCRSGFAATPAGRALTALMAGICYSQAYDPQLTALFPSWNESLPLFIVDIAPGLGTVGLMVAAISTGLYLMAGCDPRPVRIPFGWATAVAGLLVVVLGIIMYIALAPLYELQGGIYTILLAARVVEYTLLLVVVQRMAGAPLVGAVSIWYLALALVAAAARNVLAAPM